MALLSHEILQEPSAPPRLGYLASLDGLRAAAALAVLAYHVDGGPLRGGFLGVDVFFVLSGFLITRLLLEERSATGGVALGRFWSRRARRLLPAMAVVVAVACAWSWVQQAAVARRQTAGDGVASLLYVANWRFIRESASYFAPLVQASPLRHLWSLAVEEQWYLVWPVVVVLVLRAAGPRVLAALCGTAALASAVWMAYLVRGGDLDRAYYGTDARAHSLLLGSLLAAASIGWPALEQRWCGCHGNRVGLVSLAVLAVAAASAGASDPWLYRGGFLLVAVASAGVVGWLAFGLPSPVHRVLGCSTAVWLGKRSYAIYLWHWPVIVALTADVVHVSGAALGMFQAAVTVGLAALSYRLVEAPVRVGMGARRGLLTTAGVLGAAGVVAIGLLASGVALPATRPGAVLSMESVASASQAIRADGAVRTDADASAGQPTPEPAQPAPVPAEPAQAPAGVEGATAAAPPPLHVALLGDSQAWVVADDTAKGGLAPGVELSAWATIGCGLASAPSFSAGQPLDYPGEACDRWPEEWARKVAETHPDVVAVLVGAWEVADVMVDGQVLVVGTPAHDEWLLGRFRTAFASAGASGAPVVALELPCYAAHEGWNTIAAERNDPARIARVNGLLRQAAAEAGQAVAPQSSFVCDGGVERALPDGGPLRYDGVHYTPAGAAAMWAWLTPLLKDAARVTSAGSLAGASGVASQSVPSAS